MPRLINLWLLPRTMLSQLGAQVYSTSSLFLEYFGNAWRNVILLNSPAQCLCCEWIQLRWHIVASYLVGLTIQARYVPLLICDHDGRIAKVPIHLMRRVRSNPCSSCIPQEDLASIMSEEKKQKGYARGRCARGRAAINPGAYVEGFKREPVMPQRVGRRIYLRLRRRYPWVMERMLDAIPPDRFV